MNPVFKPWTAHLLAGWCYRIVCPSFGASGELISVCALAHGFDHFYGDVYLDILGLECDLRIDLKRASEFVPTYCFEALLERDLELLRALRTARIDQQTRALRRRGL
jgi:hypothetical protein